MAKVSDLPGIIREVKTNVDIAKTEISTKIQALEDAINNNNPDPELPADVETALEELKSSVKVINDIVPDAAPTEGQDPTGTPPAAALAASRKNTL